MPPLNYFDQSPEYDLNESHENSFPKFESVHKSPFGKQSVFNQSDWMKRLSNLMLECQIEEFAYKILAGMDGGQSKHLIFYGIQYDNHLKITVPFSEKSIDELFKSNFSEKGNCIALKNKNGEIAENSTTYSTFITKYNDDIFWGHRNTLKEEELERIYFEIKRACEKAKSEKKNELLKKFQNFSQGINKQLSNPFFREVDIAANIQLRDGYGKILADDTQKTNYKKKINDIKLQVFLNEDGTYEVKLEYSENYLKEFEDKWVKEAKARGLKVNIPNMRAELIEYLNSEEAKQSLLDSFLNKAQSWFDSTIVSLVEGIQVTQKISRNVWSEGEVNKSTWYAKKEFKSEHSQWPKYAQFNSGLAGVTDGVIDEVVGIPMACKSIYQLCTDKEKRAAAAKIFTKEGFNNFTNGIKEDAIDTWNDEELLYHFGGKTIISVGSMFLGVGVITKIGKVDNFIELAETAIKKVDNFPSPRFSELCDLLKKSKRTVADEKMLKEIIEEVGEEALEDAASELMGLARLAAKNKKPYTWEEVKQFFKRGNDFNKKVKFLNPPKYDYHELRVEGWVKKNGKKVKKNYFLDSYQEGVAIVSRKATNFDKIELKTFEGYLKEIKKKYPEGSKITSKKYADKIEAGELGKTLKGELTIEVPLINKQSNRLKEFQKLADDNEVKLVFEAE